MRRRDPWALCSPTFVVDLLLATHGEDTSDVALAERIAEAARPVARVRGWRVPRWWREFLVPEER